MGARMIARVSLTQVRFVDNSIRPYKISDPISRERGSAIWVHP